MKDAKHKLSVADDKEKAAEELAKSKENKAQKANLNQVIIYQGDHK